MDLLVPIEGCGRLGIIYLGYVEIKMQIPGINSSKEDVLMLVSHTTTCYHQQVPFQVGSRIINQVDKNLMDEKLRSF